MSFDRSAYIAEESSLKNELRLLFKHQDLKVLFEIGACEGEDTVKYSRLFPSSQIFSFEPLPENIELLQRNMEKYKVENASVYPLAFSSTVGKATFFVSSGRPPDAVQSDWDYGNKSSSLLPPGNYQQLTGFLKFETEIEVETSTIKTFCVNNNIDEIDFIHLDVQGAELLVLQGAEEFINKIKVIWLEVSKLDIYTGQPLVADIASFMDQHDFILLKNELHGLQGDQLYVSRKYFSKATILPIKIRLWAGHFGNRLLNKLRF